MRHFLLRKLILCILLLLPALHAHGYEEWIPIVANFSSDAYGSGHNTWRIDTYGQWAYFANEHGLMEYTGADWRRYTLNNRSAVHSVLLLPQQRRIWVGGEFEFGYFDIAPQGSLRYHCVSDSLPAKSRATLGTVCDIYEMGGVIFIRCNHRVLMIASGHTTEINSQERITASAMLNGSLYVGSNDGLRVLMGTHLVPVCPEEFHTALHTSAMIPFRGGLLIATATKGLFFYDGNHITPFHTSIDKLLYDGSINCMALRGNRLAFGTQVFGLLVLDLRTGDLEKYDNSNGMQSNMVQSLHFDSRGNLWCGLNMGIDYVLMENPFTYLYRKPRSYGLGHAAMLIGDRLYLCTNQSLFYVPYPVKYDNYQTVLYDMGTPIGTAWNLYRHGSDLLLMHERGLFQVTNNGSRILAYIDDASSCTAVKGHPDLIFVGGSMGVHVVRKNADGQWQDLGAIKGIYESGRFMKQKASGQISLYNIRTGTVTTYTLAPSLLKVVKVAHGKETYLPEDWTRDERAMLGIDVTSHVCHINKDLKVIPCDEGFMLYDRRKARNENFSVLIETIYAAGAQDSLMYSANFMSQRKVPSIRYAYNSLRIEYKAAPLYPARRVLYQYRLWKGGKAPDADKGWSAPTSQTFRTLVDLHEGDYTFEVRSVIMGVPQATDRISFTILPPWYRTWWAYLLYLLLLVAAGWFVVRLENRRLSRRTDEALKEKNEEVSQMKVEISKLEKDKMELDLRHKSQEIANLMIGMTSKNQILDVIKTDIIQAANRTAVDTAAQRKRTLLLISSKIDSNKDGDEVLKRFEREFDLLNNNFMQTLQQRHPDLSNIERLTCAYLKMGLSTKEMAPLLNVSIRGVESVRFRLRKKLNIDSHSNLTDYLNSLQ